MVDEKYAVSYNNLRRWMNLILIKTCKMEESMWKRDH